MYRYLAIVWDQRSTDRARLAGKLQSAVLSKPTEWSVAFEAPGIFVAHTGVRRGSGRAYLLKNSRGVVLGTLFNGNLSSTASPNAELDDGSTRSIVGSCGQYLVDHYWGSYVAFVHDSDRQVCHVLREPTGTVPCYRMAYHDIQVFFCWAEDCIGRLPLSFLPNRQYVSRWLIFSGSGSRDCGLEGVEDVLGGECLTIRDRSVERKQSWNPVAIASRPRLEQADEAASELRSTIQNAVNAWASNYSRIVLRLSGGLDSSIVAACLASTLAATTDVSQLRDP